MISKSKSCFKEVQREREREMISKSKSCFKEVLPYLAMVSLEFMAAGVTTLTRAAITRGASQLVVIVYSNAIGALFLLPSSYVLERSAQLLLGFITHKYASFATIIHILGWPNWAAEP